MRPWKRRLSDGERSRRQGRPYTLVLTKTDALFAREQEARIRDETDLEWLATQGIPVLDRCNPGMARGDSSLALVASRGWLDRRAR